MKRTLATALLAAALASPAFAATELLTNGGFETGDLTGWTCTGADSCFVTSAQPNSGGFNLQGFDNDGFATLSQSIATTIGATYDFSVFALSTQDTPANVLRLSAAGSELTATRTAGYTQTTLSFTALAAVTEVAILFETDPGTGVWVMDDASVTGGGGGASDVPLPAAAPLLLMGLGGLVALRRRG